MFRNPPGQPDWIPPPSTRVSVAPVGAPVRPLRLIVAAPPTRKLFQNPGWSAAAPYVLDGTPAPDIEVRFMSTLIPASAPPSFCARALEPSVSARAHTEPIHNLPIRLVGSIVDLLITGLAVTARRSAYPAIPPVRDRSTNGL